MAKVSFNKKGVVYNELKKNVDQYFKENNFKKTGNRKLYLKGLILITSACAVYITLLLLHLPLLVYIFLSFTFGILLAGIGFNVMHDGCHNSYSSKKWVNELCALTLNALGGNSFIYQQKHNIHHAYTNIDGIDDDIAKSPLMRQCVSQRWLPIHRYQHLYIVLVYCLSGIAWITLLDFTKYFTRKIHIKEIRNLGFHQHIIFWLSKVLYVVFYLALPVYFVGTAKWATAFICMNISMGLTLALIFQMAHVVEMTEFEAVAGERRSIENEWAVHQLRSTANFAPQNKFLNWFSGGLNYQIEHHLFPGISHIHYPALSVVIKKTCEEFNLPYHSYPSMSQAILSHFRLMKKLGKKDV